jgi:enoyl-CoA hydratase
MILTGSPMDAERLFAAGVINAITEPGGAVEAAVALAERICVNAPLSVQACLEAVNALLAVDDVEGPAATQRAMRSLVGTHDQQEGVRAFFERRPPEWTGR